MIISPLGVVPKKSGSSFRLIHDLSSPCPPHSVNSHIPPKNYHVTLESFDTVANLILQSGKHSLVAKADIENAFRIIPISPLDYHKLGFTFKGKYYFDRVLPMGASSSVSIFESFSNAIQWILQYKLNCSAVSHIIDDFIFVGRANTSECSRGLQAFFGLCGSLGIPIKNDKTVLPSTEVTVHGITVNTTTLMARLPDDKLTALRALINSLTNRKKISLRQLQSVIGHLNFACKVVKPGRCFLRRLYNLTIAVSNPSHLIKLNKETRADLRLWSQFLDHYNGCTLMTGDRFVTSKTLRLQTDAASTKGFSCIFDNMWTFGAFPSNLPGKAIHINILELYPITLAVHLFGYLWQHKNILFLCDNLTIVHCINKQSSKDPIIMTLLRVIVLKALECNFCFAAKHVPSVENTLADKLSRLQVDDALSIAPHLDRVPLPIPRTLAPTKLLR